MAQSEKIIISVELKDKGVTTGSKKAKDSIDDLTESAKRLAKAEKELAFQESTEGQQLAQLTIKKQLATKANRELAIQTMKTAAATKEGKTQTGLNNAILVEAGRAASDFQYGMQGMANNIGQLSTLMGQHIQTQGGFVASMKELGKSFFGMQGVLIGVQLLISFLPKLEKMYKENKDSLSAFNDALENVGDSVSELSGNFETYISKIQNSETSQEQYNESVKKLKKEFPDYIKSLDDAGISLEDVKNSTDKAAKANEAYRKTILDVATSNAAKTLIEKESVKILNQMQKKRKAARDAGFKDEAEAREKLARLFEIQEQAETRSGRAKTKFLEQNLSLEDRALMKTVQSINGADAKIKKRRETIQSLVDFAIIKNKDVDDDDKRRKKVTALEDNTFKGRYKRALQFFSRRAKAEKDSIELSGKIVTKDVQDNRTALQKKLDDAQYYALELKDIQETAQKIGGLAIAFMDAEVQAEEAKTAKINNQLKERLNNENLSADERKRIQAKIAENDMVLAKKKNKLAEKQFKIDKALAISSALINTYSAAVGVMDDTPGTFLTRLSAALPTIAFGLAQVATIAKQKFVPTAVSTPAIGGGGTGGAGGGAAVQAPAFNIVGSSNVNQLSDAIAGQGDRPVRTYVVASDVVYRTRIR